jgi:4'-phosphopantetheinyl transferase
MTSAVPTLGPDSCQVWWARLADHADWHQRLLSRVERERADKYLRACDRHRFTLGVALTRLVVAAHLRVAPAGVLLDRSCPRCRQPHGRPRLAESTGLEISVSHSGELVAVAITRVSAGDSAPRSVGVDVEHEVRMAGQEPHDMVLSPAERLAFDALDGQDRTRAFFRYWVRKEAVLKATGDGLAVSPTELTVSGPDQPPRLRDWRGRPGFVGQVWMHDLEASPGYAASLALVGRDAVVLECDAAALIRQP